MSTNGDTSVVMKGITHGACDYLIKPIRIEALKNIWQHVLRRKGRDYLKEEVGECDDREGDDSPESSSKKRKDSGEYGDEVIDDISSLKRARVHWTVQLHQQFVTAVNQLGVDKAVPKRIVEIMKVQGLSRENVASHLQKYRLYLKRLSGSIPESYPVASFQAADDSLSGGTMKVHQRGKGSAQSSVVKGLNLGAGVSSSLGIKELDQGTLKSLEQFRAYQQKIAANRAQVLGGLGVLSRSSNSSNMGGSSKGNKNGLHRMSSLDVGMLWKVQCEQDEEKKLKAAKMNLPPKAVSSSKENVITFDQGFEQKASFDHSFEQKVAFDNKNFEQKDPSFESKSFDQKATKFDPKFEQKDAFEKKIVEQKMVNQWQPGEPIRADACSISFQGSSSAAQFEAEHHANKPILKNVNERQPMEDTPWSGSSFRPGFLKSVGGPRNPLNRMSSIDMGLLWKAQQEQSEDYEKPGRIQFERQGSRRTIMNSFAPLPAWQNQSMVSVEKTDSTTTIKSIIPDVNELHSLDDISWLDDTYKSQSPKILAPSTNIFDSFIQVAGSSPEPNIPESDSSKQSFPPTDYGLSDISEYLMDDFNSNK